MECPKCGYDKQKVIDTRDTGDSIRRRRRCHQCSHRFTTYEHISPNLWVVKNDGRREPFDRQKLLSGIQIAAVKRPISREKIDQIIVQIEDSLQNVGGNEIKSDFLGKTVLDQLATLDQVAYIRFASVYLNMNDLTEVQREVDRLIGR